MRLDFISKAVEFNFNLTVFTLSLVSRISKEFNN